MTHSGHCADLLLLAPPHPPFSAGVPILQTSSPRSNGENYSSMPPDTHLPRALALEFPLRRFSGLCLPPVRLHAMPPATKASARPSRVQSHSNRGTNHCQTCRSPRAGNNWKGCPQPSGWADCSAAWRQGAVQRGSCRCSHVDESRSSDGGSRPKAVHAI